MIKPSMINQFSKINNQNKFDLVERTAIFGENIIDFSRNISNNPLTQPLISQIVRSGTSIGANYCEANESNSKKDFRYKVVLAKKEAKETMHWLRMIAKAEPTRENETLDLLQEAHELVLIFSSIVSRKTDTPS